MPYTNLTDPEVIRKQRACVREHYRRNKDYYKKKARRAERKALDFVESIKIKCSRCSECFPQCLEFHHVHGKKQHCISLMARSGFSIESIAAEIAKCVILCANCHRKETFKRKYKKFMSR